MDLYSAFIVVPHTQGTPVQITQCCLQITPYLPLSRKHSPDGASRDRLRTSNCSILLIYLPRKDERLSLPGWLTYSGRFAHINSQPQVECRTAKVRLSETDVLPLCHATNRCCDGMFTLTVCMPALYPLNSVKNQRQTCCSMRS